VRIQTVLLPSLIAALMVVSVASVARPCMGAFSLFLDVFRVLQSDKPLVNLAVLCEGKMKNYKSQIHADGCNTFRNIPHEMIQPQACSRFRVCSAMLT
jgi:hypothetical protein